MGNIIAKLLVVLGAVTFPSDRPSPIFSVMAQVTNSGVLVVGFKVILSTQCGYNNLQALALGIVNAMVNMAFAVAMIALIRRKISKGISRSVSTFRLFFLDPLMLLYCIFLIWEVSFILWCTAAPQSDGCSSAIYTQVILLGMSLGVGFLFFTLTFSTEGCRSPRWRLAAHAKWEEAHSQWDLDEMNAAAPSEEPISDDVELDPAPRTEVESSVARTRTVTGSTSIRRGVGSTFDRSNSMGSPSTSWA